MFIHCWQLSCKCCSETGLACDLRLGQNSEKIKTVFIILMLEIHNCVRVSHWITKIMIRLIQKINNIINMQYFDKKQSCYWDFYSWILFESCTGTFSCSFLCHLAYCRELPYWHDFISIFAVCKKMSTYEIFMPLN